jgi:hypothetical protein
VLLGPLDLGQRGAGRDHEHAVSTGERLARGCVPRSATARTTPARWGRRRGRLPWSAPTTWPGAPRRWCHRSRERRSGRSPRSPKAIGGLRLHRREVASPGAPASNAGSCGVRGPAFEGDGRKDVQSAVSLAGQAGRLRRTHASEEGFSSDADERGQSRR